MDGSKIGGIVLAILIGAGVVWFKFSAKGDASAEVREQVITALERLPDYAAYEALYVQWLDAHHERLFEANYRMGGRRSRSSFDSEAYVTELLALMANDATAQGYTEQADRIIAMRDQVYIATD